MQWEGWYCIAVLMCGLTVLTMDVMGPDFAMLGTLCLMMLPGPRVISSSEALEGFANEGLLTVAILFVLAAGISETGGLDYFFTQLLGIPATTEAALVRLVVPIVMVSAFLNNTPVVAIMIPIVVAWCRQAGLSPGHLFMPLSFAAIVGGTVTLIGTSTNLVVAGKHRDRFPDAAPIGMFDLTPYGLPVAVAGAIYIILFAPRLLPGEAKRRRSRDDDGGRGGDSGDGAFLVGLRVLSGSPVIGKPLAAAGMRGLGSTYLASVQRGGAIAHAVSPDFVLARGDVLVFAGDLRDIASLAERFRLRVVGDAFEEDLPALLGSPSGVPVVAAGAAGPIGRARSLGAVAENQERSWHLKETSKSLSLRASAVGADSDGGPPPPPSPLHATTVSPKSEQANPVRLYRGRVRMDAPDLLGVSVRAAGFPTRMGAAIVSIRRGGEAVRGRLGDVELQGGDELLVDAGPRFGEGVDAVRANLEGIERVAMGGNASEEEGTREFVFAFRVEGRAPRQPSSGAPESAPLGQEAAAPKISEAPSPGTAVRRSASFLSGLSALRGAAVTPPLAGRTIEAAGLRGLQDVFLVAIERGGETLHAVAPTETLHAGDVLWFAGSPDGVILLRKIPGLRQVDDQINKLQAHVLDRRLVQVVLSRRAPLAGQTVREARFRTNFDAAIIAIHRAGQRLRQRIGDIELAAGDVLLLDTGARFLTSYRSDSNFALVAEVANSRPPRLGHVVIALSCAAAAIAAYVAGLAPLVMTALAASGAMLLTGCLSGTAARAAVKWEVIVSVAAAFGLSNAMENTGAAQAVADVVVFVGHSLGGTAAIHVAIYVATALLANVIANNAAAALMYPIASAVAAHLGMRQDLMAYLLMLAASASFAVPFAYQTNLMVYGAGGYRFKDFITFGAPMQVWQGAISCVVIIYADHVWVILLVVSVAAVAVIMGPTVRERMLAPRSRRSDPSEDTSEPLLADSMVSISIPASSALPGTASSVPGLPASNVHSGTCQDGDGTDLI